MIAKLLTHPPPPPPWLNVQKRKLRFTRHLSRLLFIDRRICVGEVGSGVTNFELKTLQAQNEKLRETLVSMRDLSAHEKHEIQKLTKVFFSFLNIKK